MARRGLLRRARLALLLATATRCGGEERLPPAPVCLAAPIDVVVLASFDTARADRFGAYGATSGATPTCDRLAAEGLLFSDARATAPITLPSHASMLSGVAPPAHGLRDNAIYALDESALLVQELLAPAGWATGAFVGSMILDARYGLAQGFAEYRGPSTAAAGVEATVLERPAAAVVDDAFAWVAKQPREQRLFLFVHFYDAHAPHVAPAGSAPFADAYDAEIAHADAELGRLLAAFAAAGRQVATVVTADHGESFGAHGEESHGIFVYDATARVPLIVHAPGRVADERCAAPVSVADIARTLLDLADVPSAALPTGAAPSLLATVAEPDAARAIYVESFMPFHSYRWHPLQALVWQGFKLVRGRGDELYDLASDPGETRDLAAEQPQRVAQLAARLDALLHEQAPLGTARGQSVSAEQSAQLAQLGYTAGSAGSGAADGTLPASGDATLPDPRARIGDLAAHMRARELVREGGLLLASPPAAPDHARRLERGRALLQEARGVLDAIRAAHPADPEVDRTQGFLELSLGDHAAAIAPLERICLADPLAVGSRWNLALSYAATGHEEWAVLEMEKIATVEPRFTRAYEWLLARCERAGDLAGAAFWLQRHVQHAANLEERRRLDRKLAPALATLKKRGQKPAAPATFPVAELRPEGMRAREPAGAPKRDRP
ncbi:MAG: sulfatase-like hydrolase/transferase [Planctomycetes bacterium]|nr:sulfatase-like hydrolase/transferase [Planctomycetota bacterium]